MTTGIVIGSSLDPYLNLAYEEYLVDTAGPDEAILFLWQNHDTVVIGCNQNPWRECDLAAMERDKVKLARRVTGGGAVFHDMGNLNFSFIVPKSGYDVVRQGSVIIGALVKVGIVAVQTGRNDITIEGRKFSGNAFLHRKTTSLHHGTILIGADMSRLSGYLQVDPEKLAGKGIASVRSRVVNLDELLPDLHAEKVMELVAESFSEVYGAPVRTDRTDLSQVPEAVRMLAKRNASWDWLYGRTAEFTMSIRTRFPWGGVEIGFVTRKAMVEEVKVWSDSILPEIAPLVSQSLQGAPFLAASLARRIRDLQAGLVDIQSDPVEICNALSDITAWLEGNPL
jgi:lipoate---protein ligase